MQTVDHAVMQRSLQGKIMTVAKYKGADPGRLSCRVWHSGPSLHVALGQAWLGGKRSQDPYALVYLLRYYFVPLLGITYYPLLFRSPSTGRGHFQMGNRRTRTFDKNIEPCFNTDFVFPVAVSSRLCC